MYLMMTVIIHMCYKGEQLVDTSFKFNPLMLGDNKKITHICVTFLLAPGIKGLIISVIRQKLAAWHIMILF